MAAHRAAARDRNDAPDDIPTLGQGWLDLCTSLVSSTSVLSIETTPCPPLDLEMAQGQARTGISEQPTVQRRVHLEGPVDWPLQNRSQGHMERLVGAAGQLWVGWAWEHRSDPQAQASLAVAGRTLIPRPHQEACPSPQFLRRSGLSPLPLSCWGRSSRQCPDQELATQTK